MKKIFSLYKVYSKKRESAINCLKFLSMSNLTLFSSAAVFSAKVNKLIELSIQYKNEHPDLVFKPNLAVIPFENSSEHTKKHDAGAAVTSIIEQILDNSILFNLVDPNLRQKQIEELKLSLSGMSDTERLEPGMLETVDYFPGGAITEITDKFRITIKPVDVETGLVVNTVYSEIDRDELIEASEEIKAAYVSQYGNGIDVGYIPWMYIYSDTADAEGQVDVTDFGQLRFYLNYRINKWLVTWLGFELAPGAIRFVESSERVDKSESDFTNIEDPMPPGTTYSYKKDRSPFFSILPGAGGVLKITREFNITGGAAFGMTQTFLTQEYSIPSLSSAMGTYIITSSDISMFTLRPVIKLQYYITPRLAANIEYGFNIQLTGESAHTYYFQDGTYDNDYPIPELYNLDPSVDPAGNPYVTDMTGHVLSISIGLYF